MPSFRYEFVHPLADREDVGVVRDRFDARGALRCLKWARGGDAREAQEREVDRLLELRHPAIPRIVDWGRLDDEHYTVFEYVRGPDLAAHVKLHPERALACARDLLRVLFFLHGRGLVHGDLKPEHVLVADGNLRLIDFGLAMPLGGAPRGGTERFIPPEYLRGGAASVAGDLFAFGATLRHALAAEALASPRRLRELVEACVQSQPHARPASAEVALTALGEVARPLDKLGQLPWTGSVDALKGCRAQLGRDDGSTMVVLAPKASGGSRFVDELRCDGLRRRQPIILLEGAQPFARLAAACHVSSAAAAVAAAEHAARFVVDVRSSGASAAVVAAAARALRVAGRGTMVVVSDNEALCSELERAGAPRLALEPLTFVEARRLLHLAGVLADDDALRAAWRQLEGRAGALGRLAQLLDEQPALLSGDLTELLERQPMRPTGELLEDAEVLRLAERDVRERAPHRAVRRLLERWPTLRSSSADHPKAARALLSAYVAAGAFARAAALVHAWGTSACLVARMLQAHCLERTARNAEAVAVATQLVEEHAERVFETMDGEVRLASPQRAGLACVLIEAVRVAAQGALAAGDNPSADRFAVRGLAWVAALDAALSMIERDVALEDAAERLGSPLDLSVLRVLLGQRAWPHQLGVLRVRLVAILSDAALVRGDPAEALRHARRALEDAEALAHPALRAQSLSRIASAQSLSGAIPEALDAHRRAFVAAQEAGDVVALPPYVMNLATAEHASGDLGSAVEHYQHARRLAVQVDRPATAAAALANLAGLLVVVGAHDEARAVLVDAAKAARQADSPLYRIQAILTRAEIDGVARPERGVRLAKRAARAFEAHGLQRQVLEAQLLEAELLASMGACDAALRLCEAQDAPLRRAGLAPRAFLLLARCAMRDRRFGDACVQATRAAEEARSQGDRMLEGYALRLLGAAHGELGTGAAAPALARADEAFGLVAASLPAGLRERFLAHTGRGDPAPAAPDQPTTRMVGERLRRLVHLVRRVLGCDEEDPVLQAAVDEAIALTGAERAFLLRKRPGRAPAVAVARNLDRDTIRRPQFRFSRSVAERVLATGETVVTSSAMTDPTLQSARSIMDLKLRSIACVPVRGRTDVIGALYLDHRFESDRFRGDDVEFVHALADLIGIVLEQARLNAELAQRAAELGKAHDALSRENEQRKTELERAARLLASGFDAEVRSEGGMIGRSAGLRRALEIARRVSRSDLPVVIVGESGTGKELLARYVHERSLRCDGPFVAINCSAIPEPLLESELFGHVRGAFTGATHEREGLFHAAATGTMFLDEIGEMPLRMQAKLLRVLQQAEVRKVGGSTTESIDVRIVAATNRDLEREVDQGRFRRDLYFRLVGAMIALPPLRDRKDDIPELAQATLQRFNHEHQRAVTLTPPAIALLLRHDWPGNVRELEQTILRGALLSDGDQIEADELGLPAASATRRVALRSFDRKLVEGALRASGGNRTAAATALGISRVTLHRWIRRYDLAR